MTCTQWLLYSLKSNHILGNALSNRRNGVRTNEVVYSEKMPQRFLDKLWNSLKKTILATVISLKCRLCQFFAWANC